MVLLKLSRYLDRKGDDGLQDVVLLGPGGYISLECLRFPVTVRGYKASPGNLWNIPCSELEKLVGHEIKTILSDLPFFNGTEAVSASEFAMEIANKVSTSTETI